LVLKKVIWFGLDVVRAILWVGLVGELASSLLPNMLQGGFCFDHCPLARLSVTGKHKP
jgi:hypothetical protein